MFSFRLSQANEFCRWSWFWGWQQKWNERAEESVTCGFGAVYHDSVLKFATLRRKETISSLCSERERERAQVCKVLTLHPKYSSFLQRPPQQKRKPLLFIRLQPENTDSRFTTLKECVRKDVHLSGPHFQLRLIKMRHCASSQWTEPCPLHITRSFHLCHSKYC